MVFYFWHLAFSRLPIEERSQRTGSRYSTIVQGLNCHIINCTILSFDYKIVFRMKINIAFNSRTKCEIHLSFPLKIKRIHRRREMMRTIEHIGCSKAQVTGFAQVIVTSAVIHLEPAERYGKNGHQSVGKRITATGRRNTKSRYKFGFHFAPEFALR